MLSNKAHDSARFELDDVRGITIRESNNSDRAMLEHLSQLDSQQLPSGPFLVAEAAGEVRAAYSLSQQRAIADPFQSTADLVALLKMRARQLNGRGPRIRFRPRPVRSDAAGSSPGPARPPLAVGRPDRALPRPSLRR